MSAILMLMLPAFTACVVLLGIHVYLGIHVLSRGVIFVDLALAQVAALGVTTALLLGAEPGSGTTYAVSLGFTMVGALLFTFARGLSDRVPVEAIIGIVITSAVAIWGVLIVFSYLVIPAVIVALFTRDLTKRLFAGWGVGILASALGMYTSYTLDTPTGAAVVACFGGLLPVAIGLSRFVELPAEASSPAVRHERTAK